MTTKAASPSTSFTARRINATTFLITEDDSYDEHPFIYAKLHPTAPVLILSDTGCDSPREKGVSLTHLRQFLEEFPVPENDDRPINGGPEKRAYFVICTHCHYDHIGGIEQFVTHRAISGGSDTTTQILASAAGKAFIEDDLPAHSLCEFRGMPTPRYKVTHWAEDLQHFCWHSDSGITEPSAESRSFELKPERLQKVDEAGIMILQTPGHTPDSLAWYDVDERWLYTGDTFYEMGEEGMPIIFPAEGDWVEFVASLRKLLEFVRKENAATVPTDASDVGSYDEADEEQWTIVQKRVKVGCAHTTAGVDGEEIVEAVIELFEKIIAGKVPVMFSKEVRGEVYDLWCEDGQSRFSVRAPRRLCEEARKHCDASCS